MNAEDKQAFEAVTEVEPFRSSSRGRGWCEQEAAGGIIALLCERFEWGYQVFNWRRLWRSHVLYRNVVSPSPSTNKQQAVVGAICTCLANGSLALSSTHRSEYVTRCASNEHAEDPLFSSWLSSYGHSLGKNYFCGKTTSGRFSSVNVAPSASPQGQNMLQT